MSRDSADIARIKIGDAAALVGVKPHVLRYWESEFPMLRPRKTRGAHRLYSLRDVELAQTIHRLLQNEGYTIAGARTQLAQLARTRRRSSETELADSGAVQRTAVLQESAAREVAYRADLLALRSELLDLLDAVNTVAVEAKAEEPRSATVEHVVPSAVPVPRRR